MTKNEIEAQIYQVFRDTKYPGDSNIVYDPDDCECQYLLEHFRGKTWWEVDHSAFLDDGLESIVGFLSDEGYRYYLPFFMLLMMEDSSLLDDSVPVHMTYSANKIWHENRFLSIFMPLTLDQKYCVRDFLRYLSLTWDEVYRQLPEEALSSFWQTLPVDRMRERWNYCINLEKQFKRYYANLHIDREVCLQELEKTVFENSSDEEIGRLMVYFLGSSEELGGSFARNNRGKEEPRLREGALFQYCLRRLENSSDGEKALNILLSIQKDLRLQLDANYEVRFFETLSEMQKKYACCVSRNPDPNGSS